MFGECLNYKSGLRILIWPLEVPFFWSQRLALLAKVAVFGPKLDKILGLNRTARLNRDSELWTLVSKIGTFGKSGRFWTKKMALRVAKSKF